MKKEYQLSVTTPVSGHQRPLFRTFRLTGMVSSLADGNNRVLSCQGVKCSVPVLVVLGQKDDFIIVTHDRWIPINIVNPPEKPITLHRNCILSNVSLCRHRGLFSVSGFLPESDTMRKKQ